MQGQKYFGGKITFSKGGMDVSAIPPMTWKFTKDSYQPGKNAMMNFLLDNFGQGTLEWLHGETGIGFGLNKPIVILSEQHVVLGGLPSYLTERPVIEFSRYKLPAMYDDLAVAMLSFRDWLKDKKGRENWSLFGQIGGITLGGILAAVGVGAIADGYLSNNKALVSLNDTRGMSPNGR